MDKKHFAFFLKKRRKKSNPIAKALKFFTPKVINNKKAYDRKKAAKALHNSKIYS